MLQREVKVALDEMLVVPDHAMRHRTHAGTLAHPSLGTDSSASASARS